MFSISVKLHCWASKLLLVIVEHGFPAILGHLGLLRFKGFFVEFGTQAGDECSSRNFRVRFGWKGVAFDGTFKNDYFGLAKQFIKEETIERRLLAKHL